MGKFVIKLRKNGEFQFDLKASNGQVILSSEGYKSKASCKNGIESVKRNSQVDARFERKEAKNGAPYFNLKATNGQVIGTSEMYSSVDACENGIASVKKNAPEAEVVDETIA
ncbi:MAG: YegP family protein [Rikenellaceae bacterium]|nr:YegP family protein [Rikenellaceae bacterium]